MTSTLPRIVGYDIVSGPPEPLARATELISIVETSIDGRSDVTDSILTMMINSPGTDAHIDTITVREPGSGDAVHAETAYLIELRLGTDLVKR